MIPRTAIVLAGGLGTRLKGVHGDLPKPMASIAGRPLLEYLLEYLEQHGVSRVVLGVCHKKDVIIDHFGDSFGGVSLSYCVENEPLGTGGAIRGLTMAAFNLEKNAFIATSAFIDFMIDFSRTFVYYSNGYIHRHDLKYVPFLLIIGLIGTFLGKRILAYIPQSKFRKLSLFFILLIGIATLIQVFSD